MTRKILFVLITIGVCISFFRANAVEVNNVSIINLISTPDKYEGKFVRIFGFVKLEFEGTGIYLTEADLKNYLGKNGLWLEGVNSDQWGQYNGSLCLVEGIFDSKNTGHMGAWSGAIKNVSRIKVWKINQIISKSP